MAIAVIIPEDAKYAALVRHAAENDLLIVDLQHLVLALATTSPTRRLRPSLLKKLPSGCARNVGKELPTSGSYSSASNNAPILLDITDRRLPMRLGL